MVSIANAWLEIGPQNYRYFRWDANVLACSILGFMQQNNFDIFAKFAITIIHAHQLSTVQPGTPISSRSVHQMDAWNGHSAAASVQTKCKWILTMWTHYCDWWTDDAGLTQAALIAVCVTLLVRWYGRTDLAFASAICKQKLRLHAFNFWQKECGAFANECLFRHMFK